MRRGEARRQSRRKKDLSFHDALHIGRVAKLGGNQRTRGVC